MRRFLFLALLSCCGPSLSTAPNSFPTIGNGCEVVMRNLCTKGVECAGWTGKQEGECQNAFIASCCRDAKTCEKTATQGQSTYFEKCAAATEQLECKDFTGDLPKDCDK